REEDELDRTDDRVRHSSAARADRFGEERKRQRPKPPTRDISEYGKQGHERENHGDTGEDRRGSRRQLSPEVGRLELRRHGESLGLRVTRTRAATLNATVTTKRTSPTSASAAICKSSDATGNSFAMTLDIVYPGAKSDSDMSARLPTTAATAIVSPT